MAAARRAGALLAGTVTAGAGVVVLALMGSAQTSRTTLALLAAGVVVTELFQVPGDPAAIDPIERQSFSLSFAIIGAAALILGPWPAALVAPVGIIVVDSLYGKRPQKIAFNASVFALMGLSGGEAFVALGGHPGRLDLPHDFIAVGGLVVAAYAVETFLVGSVVALESGSPFWRHAREKVRTEFAAAAGEASLAVMLACLAESQPWAIVAVLPLLAAVFQSKAHLTTLRRETEHALETLANIVDERDPSTYRHSARVANYVMQLASALDLPAAETRRLRWAGRLHDLGKIRVDGTVLRKSGPLDEDELESLLLHPRLSARLLRRFRLASWEAQAVEYHHERFDGHGYYGVAGDEIPLAAHFLIVADAYDAMTSDRPYRLALPQTEALDHIERELGGQFHPVIGKAFVAFQRGLDPLAALQPAERAQLRQLWLRQRVATSRMSALRLPRAQTLAIGGVVVALAAVALAGWWAAAIGVAATATGLALWARSLLSTRRLTLAVDRIPALTPDTGEAFDVLVDELVATAPLTWAAYVSWSDRSLEATVEREWRTASGPPTRDALTSWLIRELESREGLVAAEGAELGRPGHYRALVLRRGGSPVGSLVLGFAKRPGEHLERALVARRDELTGMLATPSTAPAPIFRPALAAVS